MPDRKPIISGNWKMNLNHFEATAMLDKLRYLLSKEDYEAVDVSVHPPFTDIRTVQTFLESEKVSIAIGAQNCHWEAKGAYTGEVAAPMLAKLNVSYVIVGHSERRELFGDTDVIVDRKVKAVFANGMTPILCCGETLEEREGEATHGKVTGQIQAAIGGLSAEQVSSMVIAYEPFGRSAPDARLALKMRNRSANGFAKRLHRLKEPMLLRRFASNTAVR